MTRHRRYPHSGFTLIEMIAVLPLFSAILGIFTWAMITQFNITGAIAHQSDRQEVMHRILNAMRTDVLSADTMTFETWKDGGALQSGLDELDGWPTPSPDAERRLISKVILTRRNSNTSYYLVGEMVAAETSTDAATAQPVYARQFLIRIANDEEIPSRIWPLRNLAMTMAAPNTDDSSTQSNLLRLRFAGTMDLDARVPARQAFDTTLRIGGSR